MTLARQRCIELERLKISAERTSLLINRWHKSDPSPAEISKLVGHNHLKVFPNDYPAVRAAILNGRPVAPQTRLGQSYAEFAGELAGKMAVVDNSLAGRLKSLWGIREAISPG